MCTPKLGRGISFWDLVILEERGSAVWGGFGNSVQFSETRACCLHETRPSSSLYTSGRAAWNSEAAKTGKHSTAVTHFTYLQAVDISWGCAVLQGPGNQIGNYLSWWVSRQIYTVKANSKLTSYFSCSHTQVHTELQGMRLSPHDAHTSALQRRPGHTGWEQRRQAAAGRGWGRPSPSFQPHKPWVVSVLTRVVKIHGPSAGGAKGLLCVGRTWRGQEQTCPGMCLPGQGHLQALFWVSLGPVTCAGVSVVLPSIPEQEQFPASPAASWWEREERLNLQSREEEFSLTWCPGEQQPCPARCDAGELVRRI